MFKGDKIHEEIKDRIDTALSDILADYQLKYEMNGDIEPLQAVAYDEQIDNLTDLICDILQFEFDYFRG